MDAVCQKIAVIRICQGLLTPYQGVERLNAAHSSFAFSHFMKFEKNLNSGIQHGSLAFTELHHLKGHQWDKSTSCNILKVHD